MSWFGFMVASAWLIASRDVDPWGTGMPEGKLAKNALEFGRTWGGLLDGPDDR